MKITIKEATGKPTFLSHMILDSINDEAMNSLPEVRTDETTMEVKLSINGIELDVRKFTEHLENAWDGEVEKACKPEAEKLFEKMKHKFKSENSTNAQLNKVRIQLEKISNSVAQAENRIEHILKEQ